MSGHKSTLGVARYKCTSYWKNPGKERCTKMEHSIICYKIDDRVWDWICNLLTDEQSLEDGLNKMIVGNKDETGTRRKRLESLKNLIAKRGHSIERLITELSEGVYDDEFTRKIFQDKINENKEVIKELQKEHDRLEAELAQAELTEDFRQEVRAMAAQVRDKLADATYENKRVVMDKLDLKAVFRYEEKLRWLELTCNLSPEGLSYDLQQSRNLYFS